MTISSMPLTDERRATPDFAELPRLERHGGVTRLLVDGKPYLAIGGELHNSTSSDPAYLRRICQSLRATGVTTIVATVSWAEVEPYEGEFDFTPVAGVLAAARESELRVVLIWFGAFKNAHSSYAPTWVRADAERFPRAETLADEMPNPFSFVGGMSRPRTLRLLVRTPQLRHERVRGPDGVPEGGGHRPHGDHGSDRERGRPDGWRSRPFSGRRSGLGRIGSQRCAATSCSRTRSSTVRR